MADDLRAAAERLRRIHAGESDVSVYGMPVHLDDRNDLYVTDLRWCLGRFLAEHPADEAESVTLGWWRTLSPKWTDGDAIYSICLAFAGDADGEASTGVTHLHGIDKFGTLVSIPLPVVCRTRGDVRRLAAALGITLKETNDG